MPFIEIAIHCRCDYCGRKVLLRVDEPQFAWGDHPFSVAENYTKAKADGGSFFDGEPEYACHECYDAAIKGVVEEDGEACLESTDHDYVKAWLEHRYTAAFLEKERGHHDSF